jgi:hypothetical protein
MKNLIIFSIFIFIYYLIIGIMETDAQDWPCGNSAAYNIGIPNDNSNVYLCENSVAVHPLYPNIVLNANNRWGTDGVIAYVSANWGNTWGTTLPATGFQNSICDPAACINLNGYLYVAYLVSGGLDIARSTNNGNNWVPNAVFRGGADKEHLHIDNSCTSSYKGRIYCSWSGGGGRTMIQFCYSSNMGVNWSSPVTLNGVGATHIGVNIATDNSGIVYVVWATSPDNSNWEQLQLRKSTDGGVTWIPSIQNPPVIINLQYSAGAGTSLGPSMTADMQNNTLYLVYSGNTNSQNYFDVFMKKSTDGGTTWSGETRVNQVQTGYQTYPWISCDPMTGYLACIYYDSRNGYHAYLSISTNFGSSWCDMQISNVASQNSLGGGNGNDYIGVEFNKGIIYPVWADRRDHYLNYKTFIYPFEVIAKDYIVQGPTLSGTQLIQSANTITASNVTINSGANVTMRTVNSITLLPGFYTNDNSYFSADLFHCDERGKAELYAQLTNAQKDNSAPFEFSLYQNYPNPFNPSTTIKYSLKNDSWVTIKIYNILGQEVKKLVDGYKQKGNNLVVWDGSNNYGNNVSSGIYFCKLIAHEVSGSSTGEYISQKKLVIIR